MASEADFPQLQELHRRCLNSIVALDYFRWKYKDNPAGEAVCFVACDGDIIAGFYGVIPEIFMVKGERVIVFQSMDTMTSPDYQKMGLFTKLAKLTYNYLIKSFGTVHIYGVAGLSSLPGFIHKLEWTLIYSTPYIFLSAQLFLLRSILIKRDSSVLIKEVNLNEMEIDRVQKSDLIGVPIRPELSAEFLKWRIGEKPNSNYRVVKILDRNLGFIGWSVFSIETNKRCKIEYLGRFSGWTHFHTYALMDFLFASFDLRFIYTWKPTDKGLWNAYKRQGFLFNPFSAGPFSYRVPFIVYSNCATLRDLSWFDKSNFDFQPLLQD